MPPLRVMVHNVHGFRAGARAVARAAAAERPDVVLLNETGYLGLRLRRFARSVGMRGASGLSSMAPIPNAVLARPPWRIVDRRVVRLSRRRRTIRRGAVVTSVRRAGVAITAVAVHLGLSDRERRRHAEELTDLLAGERAEVVVGGDLNEGPEGRAVSWIAERYWDAFGQVGTGEGLTFPAHEPRARIDYLFVSQGVTVERAWVGTGHAEASDHLPVFADLVVPGGPRVETP